MAEEGLLPFFDQDGNYFELFVLRIGLDKLLPVSCDIFTFVGRNCGSTNDFSITDPAIICMSNFHNLTNTFKVE